MFEKCISPAGRPLFWILLFYLYYFSFGFGRLFSLNIAHHLHRACEIKKQATMNRMKSPWECYHSKLRRRVSRFERTPDIRVNFVTLQQMLFTLHSTFPRVHLMVFLYCMDPLFWIAEPPSSPLITGLPQNETIREGQTLKLSCTSLDGSPTPIVRW